MFYRFYFRATEQASNMSWRDGAADGSKQNGMRPQMTGWRMILSESRGSRAEVVHTEVRRTRNLAGQVAGPERAPGHEADAQFLAERQHLLLRVAGPQRVFALDRGDRLDGMGAANGVRRRF